MRKGGGVKSRQAVEQCFRRREGAGGAGAYLGQDDVQPGIDRRAIGQQFVDKAKSRRLCRIEPAAGQRETARGGRAEALEFTADRHTRFLDVPLKRLKVAPGILVAAIVRQNEIIIPYGNDVIKERDNVILIAYDTILSDLNEMVSSEE